MIRINLKNNLRKSAHSGSHIPASRIIVAISCATAALTLWACNSSGFDTTPPAPPEKKPKSLTSDPALPPENPKESEPQIPKRAISLQVTGIQPDAWWNNCLKIELNGKTFDIACTKDKDVKEKIVRIPVPEDVKCPVLDVRIETFKNVGSACAERAREGLECDGPFEQSPSTVRKYSVAEDRLHFVLSEGKREGSGKVFRTFFEDQDAEAIRSVKEDSSKAEALGIDFNDAIFELTSPPDLPFEIAGAAGTKCPQ
ncbi:MAG: hypothetical protein EBR09_07760 [Proteobacteria bacterium]|nr:hypothetical protein [Pseudomonadota bacterium]